MTTISLYAPRTYHLLVTTVSDIGGWNMPSNRLWALGVATAFIAVAPRFAAPIASVAVTILLLVSGYNYVDAVRPNREIVFPILPPHKRPPRGMPHGLPRYEENPPPYENPPDYQE